MLSAINSNTSPLSIITLLLVYSKLIAYLRALSYNLAFPILSLLNMYSASKFKPAWWLTNTHSQTVAAKFFRRKQILATFNETVELPDGDFIDLAWTDKPQQKLNL